MKLRIFDIQRLSIHDGPGIRTTLFLKGCPLQCAWCHNPESIHPEPQELFRRELCIRCGICHSKSSIISECPTGARWTAGYEIDTFKVLNELIRDREYYGSIGGVTISGGEPLMQWSAVSELTDLLHNLGIRVAVDTSCYSGIDIIEKLSQSADLVIADFKLYTKEKHVSTTGVNNKRILNAIRYLNENIPNKVWISVPLIPGVHDERELCKMAEFLVTLKNRVNVRLIPYDGFGKTKYNALGLKAMEFPGDINLLLNKAESIFNNGKITLLPQMS